MSTSGSLSIEILGRITVLQSMVTLMPDKISILDFVCQGLKDVTGVKSLAYQLVNGNTPLPIGSINPAETMRVFPIKYHAVTYAELNFEIENSEAFEPYIPFLQNFVNMLGVVFEGQAQRKLNETLMEELEQRVAERTSELQEKEEDLRITLNSIGDAVISTDVSGNVTNMNPVAEELTGWNLADGIGKPLTDVFRIVNICTLQPALNPVKRVLETGEYVGFAKHTSLITKDGTRHQIADSAAPIRDIDGSICGVVLVFRDVTEEYRIAEALRTSEEKYREIVEKTADLVTTVDGNGVFTYVNHCAEKFFGLSADQCLGKSAFEWVHPEDREKTRKWFGDCIRNHLEQSSFENRQINQISREIFHLRWTNSFRYDDKGRLLWVNGLAHDITELKVREEERKFHISFLESLEQVDKVIKQETDVEQMLWNIVKTVFSIFDCDRAWLLYPCDPDAPFFRVPVEITKPEYPGAEVLNVDVPISPDQSLTILEALQSDSPVAYSDGTERPVTSGKMFGVQSQVVMSIFPKLGDPWLFGMHQCSHPRIWTEAEKRLFKEIGCRISDGLSSTLYLREVQENEERFRATFEQAAVGIAHVAPDGRLIRANQKLCDIVGSHREELLQKTFQDIIYHKDLDNYLEQYRQVLAGNVQASSIEMRCLCQDDLVVWANLTLSLVRNASDEPAYFISVIEDISERKQAVENLQKSEGHLHTLVQTIPDLIWLKDPDGVYLSCNPIFERFFGAKESEIVGKTDYHFLNRELADFFRDHDRKAIAARKPTSNEESVTFADDGHTALLETIKTPMFNESGLLIGVLGIGRDITERKKAEEEKIKLEGRLQQSQKMEAIGQLAGGVAHDFNNMLGVILGHAELAMNDVDPSRSLYANLEEIRKAANRSADITRQLLAFARKQTVVPKVIDLNETIEGMLKMLRRIIGENIDLDWLPGAGLWTVKIDPSQIDQIMANLFVNARAAIANVGKITVETGNNTFDEEYCDAHAGFVPGEYARIVVSDTGCGIDKETLPHIFEPFFTTKGVGEGTGLGLATVHGAVMQNNGLINVYSEPGRGTAFTIYLPRHVDQVGRVRTEDAVEPALRGDETILLVEDEPTVLEMTRMMLELLGYTVFSAETPHQALRMANELDGKINLLLTDVVMPEMNGRDLAQILLPLYPYLKCLFMSGYTSDIIAQQGILDEGVEFIQKPFSKQDLAIKVRLALEKANPHLS